ncbi:hypothetical protein K461DRAFT_330132 [Myriangium duriaei CBS 260.36]|uniref:Uncharacterized protein n=1 Tax=Myriangium duriaei CBS 260.36 TaxID=1168546 RepID=A0A9P4ITR6_9PEZI|nr:hypothetical protein K461DRAFT_330132 [Myriangium duriaei CBS 260.36]
MRVSAIVPILLSLGALVLSFLCLFAGSKTSFLPGYPVITLNVSEFGQNSLNSTLSKTDPALATLLNSLPDSAQSELQDAVNTVARKLGMHDFYTANVLNYCEGYYTPGPVPNATLKTSDIHKKFTNCSAATAMFQFDPKKIIQTEIDNSGHSDINITSLEWPSDIDTGLRALHAAQKAMFILYCVGLALTAVAAIFSIISFCLSGRLSAFINVLIAILAFAAIGIASAIVTVLAVHGSRLINKYGNDIGLSASPGKKFLALTWAATAAMIICAFWWCVDCCVGRRSHKYTSARYAEKPY